MKKYIKLFIIVTILFLQTGCINMNVDMTIKDNKEMELTITELVDSNYINVNMPYFNDELIKEYENIGFFNKTYKLDDLTGNKLIRTYNNIDKYSTEAILDPVEAVSNIFTKDGYIFNIKKGLFFDTYKASFNYKEYIKEVSRLTGVYNIDDSSLEFTVNLPYKADSSNATEISNKKYTWDLMNLNSDTIDFKFKIYNKINIVACFVFIMFILGYFSSNIIAGSIRYNKKYGNYYKENQEKNRIEK